MNFFYELNMNSLFFQHPKKQYIFFHSQNFTLIITEWIFHRCTFCSIWFILVLHKMWKMLQMWLKCFYFSLTYNLFSSSPFPFNVSNSQYILFRKMNELASVGTQNGYVLPNRGKKSNGWICQQSEQNMFEAISININCT